MSISDVLDMLAAVLLIYWIVSLELRLRTLQKHVSGNLRIQRGMIDRAHERIYDLYKKLKELK